ncbi:unnamed protein product [Chrysoparadoxa australica]
MKYDRGSAWKYLVDPNTPKRAHKAKPKLKERSPNLSFTTYAAKRCTEAFAVEGGKENPNALFQKPSLEEALELCTATVLTPAAEEVAVAETMRLENVEEDDKALWLEQNLRRLRGGGALSVQELMGVPGAVDCLQELLKERVQNMDAIGTLSEQTNRLLKSVEQLVHEKSSLSAQLQASQQEAVSNRKRAEVQREEHNQEKKRWGLHRKEMESTIVQLQHKDSSYRAALRKKEVDYRKLQEGLQKSMSRDKTNARGVSLAFTLPPGTKRDPSGASPLEGMVSRHYTEQVDTLTGDNEVLRDMLQEVHAQLTELKGYHEKHTELTLSRPVAKQVHELDLDALPERVDGMPVAWLRRHLGDEMVSAIMSMREQVAEVIKLESDDGSAPVNKKLYMELLENMKSAQSIIKEQDKVLRAAIFAHLPEVESHPADWDNMSSLWESREKLNQVGWEQEELNKEKELFEKQKSQEAVVAVTPARRCSTSSRRGSTTSRRGSTSLKLTFQTPGHGTSSLFSLPQASPATSAMLREMGFMPGQVPGASAIAEMSPIAKAKGSQGIW